jgi:lipopolysaccharide transport system ATP-binding protein
MTNFAIKAEKLSKRYRIGSREKKHDTLMGSITSWFKAPLDNYQRLKRLSHFSDDDHASQDIIWALKDASFEVKHGEVVGLIGRNGAGKSTMLKIISRITEPTSGRGIINGRVSSLLEVGTGFHPELTGRENIYLNGVILGMSKSEMDRKLDEIIEFSGVEKFIDTPVKRYSSGMHVRLAFSVAAHLEPEVLLIDEVLAVGDASFQKKCLGKMEEVAQGGRTILFVSHNLEAVRGLCQRALLFEQGKIRTDGPVDEVAQTYLNSLSEGLFNYENKEHGLVVQRVVLKNAEGKEALQFSPGDDLVVEVSFSAEKRIEKPYFIMVVQSASGNCFTANMLLDGHRPEVLHGKGVISCRFKSLPLLPQTYNIRMAIRAKDGKDNIMSYHEVGSFTVTGNLEKYGYTGEFQTLASRSTSVVVPYEWNLPDGKIASISLINPFDRESKLLTRE